MAFRVLNTEPALRIQCLAEAATGRASRMQLGYVSSVAAFSIEGRFIAQWVVADSTLDELAHDITLGVEGGVIVSMRRTAQPLRSP